MFSVHLYKFFHSQVGVAEIWPKTQNSNSENTINMHRFEWKISNWGLGSQRPRTSWCWFWKSRRCLIWRWRWLTGVLFLLFEVDMKHPSSALFALGKLRCFAGLDIDAESEEIWSHSMWRRCVSLVDLQQGQTDTQVESTGGMPHSVTCNILQPCFDHLTLPGWTLVGWMGSWRWRQDPKNATLYVGYKNSQTNSRKQQLPLEGEVNSSGSRINFGLPTIAKVQVQFFCIFFLTRWILQCRWARRVEVGHGGHKGGRWDEDILFAAIAYVSFGECAEQTMTICARSKTCQLHVFLWFFCKHRSNTQHACMFLLVSCFCFCSCRFRCIAGVNSFHVYGACTHKIFIGLVMPQKSQFMDSGRDTQMQMWYSKKVLQTIWKRSITHPHGPFSVLHISPKMLKSRLNIFSFDKFMHAHCLVLVIETLFVSFGF